MSTVRLTRSARKRLQRQQQQHLLNNDKSLINNNDGTSESESGSTNAALLLDFDQRGVTSELGTPSSKRRRVSTTKPGTIPTPAPTPIKPKAKAPTKFCPSLTASAASTLTSTSTSSSTSLEASGNMTKVVLPKLVLASDEKEMEGAPEGELFVVRVLSRDEMPPSTDVQAEVETLRKVLLLRQQEEATTELTWAQEYAAIDTVRRLAIHHPDELEGVLDAAVPTVVCPAATNLRSAMVRNALLCVQDLMLWHGASMTPYFDELIPLLLQRAVNEKQFIRELAHKVLETSVEECAGEVLLARLLQISQEEKNAAVVSVAGVYASKCISKMKTTDLTSFVQREEEPATVWTSLSSFLSCKVVDCKVATRRSLRVIRTALGDSTFAALVRTHLQGSAQHDVMTASEPKKLKPNANGPRVSMRERMLQMKRQQQQQQQQQAPAPEISASAATATTR